MTVSFDWTSGDTTSGDWIFFSVGTVGDISYALPLRVTDVSMDAGIIFKNSGGVQAFNNGVNNANGSFTPTGDEHLVTLNYLFTSWAADAPVTLDATVDGTSVLTDSFTWSHGAGAQYMDLGTFNNTALIDNFTIQTLPEPTTWAMMAGGFGLLFATRQVYRRRTGRIFPDTFKNLGLAGCWNACIERSWGQCVHILHQDDYILPGFYKTLSRAAERHPEVGLLATHSFFVDAEKVILDVSNRLGHLEKGGRTVDDFYYRTPIQCSGVVVKRTSYEAYGGFRRDLIFTLDCKMWARVIGSGGGLITPEVLSCYRMSGLNETERLSRTAEGLGDLERLN
jgi:hypothetical protein